MQTNSRSVAQQQVIDALCKRFEIDTEGIRFLNSKKPTEPWFPAEVLQSIARQSEHFRGSAVVFSTNIEPLKQMVHVATVTDSDDRTFTRSGAAGLNERIPDSPNADERFDPHSLAASRAATAAFAAAGFNPMKAASAVPLNVSLPSSEAQRQEDAKQSKLEEIL